MIASGSLSARARDALATSAHGLTPTELAHALFGVAATRLAPVVAQALELLTRLEARGEVTAVAGGRWVAVERVEFPVGAGPTTDTDQSRRRTRRGETSGLASAPETAAPRDTFHTDRSPLGSVSAIAATFAGARSGRPRLIEAALVRLEGGVEVMTWSSLANPDPEETGRVRLPMTVLERVGLEPEAFEGAPSASVVVAELGELIADTTVVGHDVATVLDALGAMARWHGVAPPYRRGMALVDTEAMARAVLPNLAKPSLDRVAAMVGVAPVRRDRASERARQVAAVWQALTARSLGAPAAVVTGGTIPEASSAVATDVSRDRGRGRDASSKTVGQLVLSGAMTRTAPGATLPEAPGIYRFHDGTGAVMYVGKATNLRGRVAQHFGGVGSVSPAHEAIGVSARGDALLSRVATITHEVTACELDAAVLEQTTIARFRPPYNLQLNAKQGPPYLYLDEAEAFPRIGGTHDPSSRPAEATFGPYRTAADARKVARVVARAFGIRPCTRKLPARSARMRVPCLLWGQGLCPAPCAPHVSPADYGVAVLLARAFLAGGRDGALFAIDERLRNLREVDDLAGDASERVGSRRWLEGVRRAVVRIRVDARPLVDVPRGAWLTLACRGLGRRGPGDASVVTFLVRDGRLEGRREWREVDGRWVAEPSGPVGADAPRDAIVSRRVQRDLETPRVMVSRWGAPSDATLAAWIEGLESDPLSWTEKANDEGLDQPRRRVRRDE